MKPELARLHARICGDGNISKYETSEEDRNRRAEVMYTNYDSTNIEEFRDDLDEVYDVRGTVYEDRVRAKSIRVVNSLEERFGDLSSKGFRIPDSIVKASEEVRRQWLRAFIRDEGYFEEQNNRLRVKLMNKKALEDIKNLLSSLSVDSTITGPNSDSSWYLTVSSLDDYGWVHKVAKSKEKVK